MPRGDSKTPSPPAGEGCQGARCCSFKNIFRCLASAITAAVSPPGRSGQAGPAGQAAAVRFARRNPAPQSASGQAAHLALLNHPQHMVRDICPGSGPHRRGEEAGTSFLGLSVHADFPQGARRHFQDLGLLWTELNSEKEGTFWVKPQSI